MGLPDIHTQHTANNQINRRKVIAYATQIISNFVGVSTVRIKWIDIVPWQFSSLNKFWRLVMVVVPSYTIRIRFQYDENYPRNIAYMIIFYLFQN